MIIRPNLLHRGEIATAAALLLGLLVAYTMPRGPTTASQSIIVMVTSFAVGYGAGWMLRSPWAMVLAPLAYMLAIEIWRFPIIGPTVDGLRLNEAFGILALILGRGFHGVVGVLPVILGVYWGWAIARSGVGHKILLMQAIRSGDKCLIGAIGATLGLSILAVLILLPATTPTMLDTNGQPLPDGIASLEKVRLGGHEQWIMLRGHSTDKPVLLYLSGGPGQSDLPFVRVLLDDLTRNFVVVGWDQRGTGKSYSALDPTETLTLDQAVSDTLELTNYLRQRFDEKKIYLLGESWGSTLGVLAVQRQPELYYAWIGSGQMVSQRETDRRIYQDVLTLAEKTNDTALAQKMQAYGEPPYKDMPYANAFVMGQYDRLSKPYTPPQSYIKRGTEANLGPWGIWGSEYSLVEKVNVLRGLVDMFSIMYPQLQALDFRQTVKKLEVPVYLLDGAAELSGRRDLALEWFETLQAPRKRQFTFENAGHSVVFEQFEAFSQIMRDTILPETY
ncbi:alpha/beta hydrolase [Microcoleus sp. herbarium7]|uniref:alpha/beta fold hydrolase n=1 Tax=Microcoleus sp. herbarium7 TaxID=3055435 RepID=UPI002FD4CB5F